MPYTSTSSSYASKASTSACCMWRKLHPQVTGERKKRYRKAEKRRHGRPLRGGFAVRLMHARLEMTSIALIFVAMYTVYVLQGGSSYLYASRRSMSSALTMKPFLCPRLIWYQSLPECQSLLVSTRPSLPHDHTRRESGAGSP